MSSKELIKSLSDVRRLGNHANKIQKVLVIKSDVNSINYLWFSKTEKTHSESHSKKHKNSITYQKTISIMNHMYKNIS
jgi:hypothetical protein